MGQAAHSLGFTSQENEITLEELKVTGKIPEWLSGSLFRTAPSKFEVGKDAYRHWFDGLAMLHKFSFHDQKVSYACKFLESRSYKAAKKKNKIVFSEFATDPCRDLFRKVVSFFLPGEGTDNGCVNIMQYGQQLTAATETPVSVIFDPENLQTTGHHQFDDQLAGQMTIVHPHYDERGTLFSYATHFGMKNEYQVFSLAPGSNQRELIARVPAGQPGYMHSIGMTEHFILLTEMPFFVNPMKLRFSQKPFIENYEWKPAEGSKLHVVDKNSGEVRTFETETFFAFHHVNAFEQEGKIIFDLIVYPDASIIYQLYLHHLRSDKMKYTSGQLWRFTLDLEKEKVDRQEISSAAIELPRTNYEKINAKPYHFMYGAGTSDPGNFVDNLTKIDVQEKKELLWQEVGCFPGEPVFVEKPDAKEEDDGILLSVVLDGNKQNSFLLILDAKDMKEIARAEVPQHITFGFHGQFVSKDE